MLVVMVTFHKKWLMLCIEIEVLGYPENRTMT